MEVFEHANNELQIIVQNYALMDIVFKDKNVALVFCNFLQCLDNVVDPICHARHSTLMCNVRKMSICSELLCNYV